MKTMQETNKIQVTWPYKQQTPGETWTQQFKMIRSTGLQIHLKISCETTNHNPVANTVCLEPLAQNLNIFSGLKKSLKWALKNIPFHASLRVN